MLTITELLQRRAQEYGDRAALVFHHAQPASPTAPPLPYEKRVKRNQALEVSQIDGGRLSSDLLSEMEAQTGLTPECWSYQDLNTRACQIGAWLSQHAAVGDRILLVYSPGLEFSAAFYGCLYAGMLPVPASYPKPKRPMPRLANMASDCQPQLVLTSQATLATISLEAQPAVLQELLWQATDCIAGHSPDEAWKPVSRQPEDLAFLQYTSGSTTEPRGVMVTHHNLLHNLELIRRGFDIPQAGSTEKVASSVFWLPMYHDMGLIGGILTPLYVAGTSHLYAPTTFLQRPLSWLEMLSATGASISGAPNFAYDLCREKFKSSEQQDYTLSGWRLAFCGAEPIQPETLHGFSETFQQAGFREEAFYPCYGLAESTLLVSGNLGPARPNVLTVEREALSVGRAQLAPMSESEASAPSDCRKFVSCGGSFDGQEIRIVEPQTSQLLADGLVGEIWLRGDSVALGYWQNEALSHDLFRARLEDKKDSSGLSSENNESRASTNGKKKTVEHYLRTGDLGFQWQGQLYVTGRLKDLLILRGRNHYPQDIERTAQEAHPAVGQGAAFTLDLSNEVGDEVGKDSRCERLVAVHQVNREFRNANFDEVLRAIRRAIVEEHELDPYAIVLIRTASLPYTSSGKVQRSRCRELYVQGELKVKAQWEQEDKLSDSQQESQVVRPDFSKLAQASNLQELGLSIEGWMIAWLASRTGLEQMELKATTPFSELGVDSMTAIELNQEVEEALQLKIPPVAAWDYPTPAALSQYLAEQYLEGVQSP